MPLAGNSASAVAIATQHTNRARVATM